MARKSKIQIERGEQLLQLTSLVAGELSLQEVLDRLAEAAVRIVGVKACSIRLLSEETNDLHMRSTYGLSEAYRNKGVVSKHDPVIETALRGEAVTINDMRIDKRVKYQEAAAAEGLAGQLTVAMTFRKEGIGVLRLYSPRPRDFDDDDINLARAVASQCAVAITNAKLYGEAIKASKITEQLRLAGHLQRRMIPSTLPSLPGMDIAANYIPCFDVGGDFYDFIPLGEDRIAVVIADVIGKGIPAAVMMSWLRGAVRTYTDTFQQAIAAGMAAWQDTPHLSVDEAFVQRAVQEFNRMACRECREGEFITLFYAILDCRKKTITYCSCGHEPTLLIRGDQAFDLSKGGLVLGVLPNTDYDIETRPLQDGDCLIFYTDGLIDAVNFEGDLWTKKLMLEAARKSLHCDADYVARHILQYRRRFVGLAEQLDDTSIVVVKVGPKGENDDCCAEDEEMESS